MLDDAILGQAAAVLTQLRARGWRVATAESCTGGLIAGALTAIAGSSDVVEGGFVTYSNAVKTALLGVPVPLFDSVGAVSAEVAQAMAEGVLDRLPSVDIAIAVTGIAGPGGGSVEKPVGLVYLGLARRAAASLVVREVFPGDRAGIRRTTVERALALIAAVA